MTLFSPFDLFGRLSDEEPDRVGWELGPPGVDGDLVVGPVVSLHLNCQEQQLQLHETQPAWNQQIKKPHENCFPTLSFISSTSS